MEVEYGCNGINVVEVEGGGDGNCNVGGGGMVMLIIIVTRMATIEWWWQ